MRGRACPAVYCLGLLPGLGWPYELETCLDELETSLRGGAAVVLRSKSPPMIRQEIYAMLCCYQAIRP